MMKNQSKEKAQNINDKFEKFNNFRASIINYMDIVFRSLIAFIFIGILGSLIFMGIFKWKIYIVFPIIFLLSVAVSPMLSKIKIAEKIMIKYENWLNKIFKL